jgi:signal peptidase I
MGWKEFKKETKIVLKKFWHFLWNEDSILSWIVNILLAFLIIKFLVYPGIGLAFGTDLPVVAVISESMDHQMTSKCTKIQAATGKCVEYKYELCGKLYDDKERFGFEEYWNVCGQWYLDRGITPQTFNSYPMNKGFSKGDIILLKGVTFEELEVGDVLVYQSKLTYPVIHRVVLKNDLIETKGDHNVDQIQNAPLNEKYISKDQIIGKAWIKIPYLGYVKIWFTQLIQCVTFNGCSFR